MKKYKKLNEVLKEWNGLMARFHNNKNEETQSLVDRCFEDLKKEVEEVR